MSYENAAPKVGYSLAEVEIATGLSRTSLYREIAGGRLRTVQFGRRRLVSTEQLTEFLRPQPEGVR